MKESKMTKANEYTASHAKVDFNRLIKSVYNTKKILIQVKNKVPKFNSFRTEQMDIKMQLSFKKFMGFIEELREYQFQLNQKHN